MIVAIRFRRRGTHVWFTVSRKLYRGLTAALTIQALRAAGYQTLVEHVNWYTRRLN